MHIKYINIYLCEYTGQFHPPSPMEILYEDEDCLDAPVVNRNQTGWFWFGGIIGKHPDITPAIEEALEKLSSKIHILIAYFSV